MTAATRRRTAVIGLTSGLLLLSTVGVAQAAGSASPSPSPSASASAAASASATASASASTSESAAPSASASPAATAADGTVADVVPPPPNQQLVTGIDRYLSYPSAATAVGQNAIATVTLPLPPGLTPLVVTGTLLSVADNPGTVRIRVGTEYTTLDATTGGDWAVRVPANAVTDNSITVEVRNTLNLPKGECVWDQTTSETIQDIQVGFIGRETPPQTVAGFFSPPVRKVTILSDADSVAAAEPTLAAAAALARRYDSTVRTPVMTSEEFAKDPTGLDPADGPKRIVKLVVDPQATVVTVNVDNPGIPQLTLTGPADKLTKAAAALSSKGLGLVAASNAQQLSQEIDLKPSNTLTFAQLGTPRPTLQGLGRLTYGVPAPQSRFGGPVESMKIHLEGVHSPVPQGAYVTLSLLWNNQLIASENLSDALNYTVDVTAGPTLMDRDNNLTIRADAVSAQGSCDVGSIAQSFQMDINGFASTVTATPGQALDDGFIRYPQSFGTDVHVGFGSGPITSTMVESCAALIISLQRASQLPFAVHTHDFATFASGQWPGLIVGATPADATALNAPLRFEPLRAVDMGQGIFTAEVAAPFAALEAFANGGRDILLLGGTAPADQSEALQAQIAGQALNGKFGWFGFNGTIAVAQPGAKVLFLDTNSLAPQTSVVAESRSIPWWWIAIAAVLILAIIARLIAILLRRRRVKRRLAEERAQAADEAAADEGPSDEATSVQAPEDSADGQGSDASGPVAPPQAGSDPAPPAS